MGTIVLVHLIAAVIVPAFIVEDCVQSVFCVSRMCTMHVIDYLDQDYHIHSTTNE